MGRQAEIIQLGQNGNVSRADFNGINACRRAAWDHGEGFFRRSYYPYHAFGEYRSWTAQGELGQAIARGELFASVVRAEPRPGEEQGEIVAHAALVHNKFGYEVGRVFSRVAGNGYGREAVDGTRVKAEKLGIDRIHMGVSYNRTNMWGAFEGSYMRHGWQMAVMGILPDIYSEHGLKWGEIVAMGVKDKPLVLPRLSSNMPLPIQDFARGMQQLNSPVVQFAREDDGKEGDTMALPYQFGRNVVGLDWHDAGQQGAYLKRGYKPVGLVMIHEGWVVVMHKGDLPPRKAGRRSELGKGRSIVAYPEQVGGVNVKAIMDHIYSS